MSRPLSLVICGRPFDVVWSDDTDADDDGDEATVATGMQTITMHSKDMGPDHERTVILHEVLHAIISLTSQDDRFVPKGEEAIVEAVAVALLDALRANPHLTTWLADRG